MEQKEKNPQDKDKKKQRIMLKGTFADFLEVPQEIALNLPKITIIGNVRLSIENHQGIIGYSEQEIRVKVHDGFLFIKGDQMTLPGISNEEIIINGEINTVSILIGKEEV